MVLLFGCAQTVAFRAAPGAPAALGAAKISTDSNGNAVVDVEVEHLAPPENLSPPKKLYVVWAQTPNGRFVNLGQMVVGENRVGKLYAVSPLKEFRLVVTAEDIPATITPSKQEILTTELFTID
jgi:hypothetical protein